MTPEQFAFWLQGFAELHSNQPTQEQWQSIREHLVQVFDKKTPPVVTPKIDLSKNSGLREMIESAQKRHNYEPWPPIYTPPFWLERGGIKPGDVIC